MKFHQSLFDWTSQPRIRRSKPQEKKLHVWFSSFHVTLQTILLCPCNEKKKKSRTMLKIQSRRKGGGRRNSSLKIQEIPKHGEHEEHLIHYFIHDCLHHIQIKLFETKQIDYVVWKVKQSVKLVKLNIKIEKKKTLALQHLICSLN